MKLICIYMEEAYRRMNPTIEIDHVFTILKKLNFENSSIYSDKINIEYSTFEQL